MCLILDSTVKDPFKNKEEITVYKVLNMDNTSPFQGQKYEKGINKAKGKVDKNEDCIHGGCLHVFLTREGARRLKGWYRQAGYNQKKVVKMTARKEDLVGLGYFDGSKSAAFTRLHYDPENQ